MKTRKKIKGRGEKDEKKGRVRMKKIREEKEEEKRMRRNGEKE